MPLRGSLCGPRLTLRPVRSWRFGAVLLAALAAIAAGTVPARSEEGCGCGASQIAAALAGAQPLSPRQMAAQTGEGLSLAVPKPALGQSAPPRVILWDEVRQPPSPLAAGSNQSVSVTVRVAQ